MTPDQLAKSKTEHGEQRALFAFCNVAKRVGWDAAFAWADGGPMPKLDPAAPLVVPALQWYHAIHNQGHGDAIRGAKAKAEGVIKGVADTFLPYPNKGCAGLYIEMKKLSEKSKRGDNDLKGASAEQIEFKEWAQSVGYGWALCYGWREAAVLLRDYIE